MTNPTIPEGYMAKADGSIILATKVRDQDRMRNQVARDLGTSAISLSKLLLEFKKKALADIADLISISAEKWDVKMGGEKGNITITSYDGEFQIKRVIADKIAFSEEIHVAKEMIDTCAQKWADGANENLIVAINNVFRIDKNGSLITTEVLAMLRWNIDEPEWKKAMEALSDAILINGTTVYINVYQRDEETSKYKSVPLSLSGV